METENNNTEESDELSSDDRARFFRAADLTLREGGFVHSNLVLGRSGVECTEQQMISVMRAWSESREYPLSRIHTGRLGAILMGLLGCAALILGLVASIEGNRSGRTVGHIVLTISVPLIIGAIMLWRSTSRIRDERIRIANSVCPECDDRPTANTSCDCGYLSRSSAMGVAGSIDGPEYSGTTARAESKFDLPEERAEPIWQLKAGDTVSSYAAYNDLRDDILAGRVNADHAVRLAEAGADTEPGDAEWTSIGDLSESQYNFGMLYRPVKAHMSRGGVIGAAIGVGWWLLSMAATAFGDLNNPVIGGLAVLALAGIVNLQLPDHVRFFTSRILWGAMVLGAMFSFMNFTWGSIASTFVTGLGMLAGAVFSGLIVGWLLGAAIGTVVGLARRDSLVTAPDATREETRDRLLYGVAIPLGVLVGLSLAYVFVIWPLLQ